MRVPVTLFFLLSCLVFISISTFYAREIPDITTSRSEIDDALDLLCGDIGKAGMNMHNTPNFSFLGSSDPDSQPLNLKVKPL